jgi:DNA-binding response OmpR family regulator
MQTDANKFPSPAPDNPVIPTQRVLLVLHVNDSTDDQVIFQTACSHARVPLNWHVVDSADKAISYLEALVALNKTHSVRWPDLVLLDVVMPGHSGFTVLEFIRSTPELSRLPVVIFTGRGDAATRPHAYSLGANSYLEKPLNFGEMVKLATSLYKMWSAALPPTH